MLQNPAFGFSNPLAFSSLSADKTMNSEKIWTEKKWKRQAGNLWNNRSFNALPAQ